jgi:hypothetical protein
MKICSPIKYTPIEAPEYIDDYGTCSETYATLRVYHDALPPTEVTARLGLEPDDQQFKGIPRPNRDRPAPINGWFLSSEHKVKSRDSRRHIDWLVSQIVGRRDEVEAMLSDGFRIDISSYWASRSGHGGPTISPYQMQRLARLGIEVSWDIYFYDEDEADENQMENKAQMATPRKPSD